LLTVLSVFVFPEPQPVPTSVFLHLLEQLGFAPRAGRQALQRAAGAGWIEARRTGRRAFWHFTLAGHQLMTEGRSRLRDFESSDRRWEGRFVMVNASLPDSNRARRHTLRTRLSWLGFGVMSPGTWISLRLEAEREAAELIDQLGIPGASSFVATPGAVGSFHEVVRRAWDLEAVAAEYESFIEEFGAMRPADGDEVAIALVRIVHRWRRFPFEDPMLPPEMLPRDWPGITARRLYSALASLWRPSATKRWHELLAGADAGELATGTD
jgi:phenylacetic acid degradation operon negative regulatory protein